MLKDTVVDDKDLLDKFFDQLREHEDHYIYWTDEVPKKIVVNPAIIQRLSRITGFYQRPELQGQVTTHAPVIRYIKLVHTVVTIVEDYDEKFLHFE